MHRYTASGGNTANVRDIRCSLGDLMPSTIFFLIDGHADSTEGLCLLLARMQPAFCHHCLLQNMHVLFACIMTMTMVMVTSVN